MHDTLKLKGGMLRQEFRYISWLQLLPTINDLLHNLVGIILGKMDVMWHHILIIVYDVLV